MAIRAAWALVLAMGVAGMPARAAETVKVNPALEAVLAGDPPFRAQALRLADLPVAAGPAVSLFNGRDLADWDAWLGYPDPARTYRAQPGQAPIGADAASISRVFQVVMEEGEPAIFITGRTWGGIVHRGDHANYHLRLEYKWGETKYPPRLDMPRNNGLLYHSHGAPGAVYGTWMAATEFEIMEGSVGMVVPVGPLVTAVTEVGRDRALIDPQRRYMPAGRAVTVRPPAWNVEAASDAEKPAGAWNVLDLYVLGDRAVHVVNGVPVMAVRDLRMREGGAWVPLAHGRIQLQSEGAETYFRRITLEPITRLPRVVQD
ncbi:3-keto-disaccharide hydrolase [Nitrospirillum iridis]|uniref:3-keto-alpha-glucoside-1,2-lyase/3-keto-2-hydroxy-glucal hydratase domain-containing protein n=1 Tax=Nitrospirillum iridis TaxID=765888 RepID=A0A7X0B228_9PROT|nr:DUF1080 domain-containing protein [Nitrospirillum iridis]MBB6254344.1 hypothetical protein [Nitrospirillum iridis]